MEEKRVYLWQCRKHKFCFMLELKKQNKKDLTVDAEVIR